MARSKMISPKDAHDLAVCYAGWCEAIDRPDADERDRGKRVWGSMLVALQKKTGVVVSETAEDAVNRLERMSRTDRLREACSSDY